MVGDATRVDIRVDLSNLGEDAFKSYITFVLNTDYLIFRQVVDSSLVSVFSKSLLCFSLSIECYQLQLHI